MAIIILGVTVTILYSGLAFFTLKNQVHEAYIAFFGATILSFTVIVIGVIISLFWSLFIIPLVLSCGLYLESSRKDKEGKFLKNGVFGGLWLVIPIYAYLATST